MKDIDVTSFNSGDSKDSMGNYRYVLVVELSLNEEQRDFTEWFVEVLGLSDTESVKILASELQDS